MIKGLLIKNVAQLGSDDNRQKIQTEIGTTDRAEGKQRQEGKKDGETEMRKAACA